MSFIYFDRRAENFGKILVVSTDKLDSKTYQNHYSEREERDLPTDFEETWVTGKYRYNANKELEAVQGWTAPEPITIPTI